jgi:methylenetetrahydrofolate dehydrogenase (NADP+)/methenyltetrahydrofolate cyclohydrolase
VFILTSKEIVHREEISLKEHIKAKRLEISLHVVLVGNNPASLVYVERKKKACESVGIHCFIHAFQENVTEQKLIEYIKELNKNPSIHAILVQLPLPKHINQHRVIDTIDDRKDVDGLTTKNRTRLVMEGDNGIVPCTPLGCLHLIKTVRKDISGLHAVILGRSHLVGKPLFHLLLSENMTVTIAHSKTKNIEEVTRCADVLISAVGLPKFIKKNFVKSDAVVIDVGINRLDDAIIGDVDFEDVKNHVAAITPVPGGVGPMTVLYLLKNTLRCYELIHAKY